MNTKVVYAVVSDNEDVYLEQALVSIYSLKYYNPTAVVVLVVDERTDSTIVDKRAKILEFVSEKIVIDVPSSFNKKKASRFVKTSLRDYIQGDYLFVDADTIISSSLEDIDEVQFPIAAVKDRHFSLQEHRFRNNICSYANAIDWKISEQDYIYFNSGVFYVKDLPVAYDFYHLWHSLWLNSCSLGVNIDQPSLAKTNSAFGNIIGELNGEWNCQILTNGLPFLCSAKILHYFSSNLNCSDCFPFIFSDPQVYLNLKESMVITKEISQMILNAKSEFLVNTEIIGGKMLDFQYTATSALLRHIYLKRSFCFKIIDFICDFLCRIYWRVKSIV